MRAQDFVCFGRAQMGIISCWTRGRLSVQGHQRSRQPGSIQPPLRLLLSRFSLETCRGRGSWCGQRPNQKVGQLATLLVGQWADSRRASGNASIRASASTQGTAPFRSSHQGRPGSQLDDNLGRFRMCIASLGIDCGTSCFQPDPLSHTARSLAWKPSDCSAVGGTPFSRPDPGVLPRGIGGVGCDRGGCPCFCPCPRCDSRKPHLAVPVRCALRMDTLLVGKHHLGHCSAWTDERCHRWGSTDVGGHSLRTTPSIRRVPDEAWRPAAGSPAGGAYRRAPPPLRAL